MGFVVQIMDFVVEMLEIVLQMMDFVVNMRGFVVKMMDFTVKMLDFVLARSPPPRRGRARSRLDVRRRQGYRWRRLGFHRRAAMGIDLSRAGRSTQPLRHLDAKFILLTTKYINLNTNSSFYMQISTGDGERDRAPLHSGREDNRVEELH